MFLSGRKSALSWTDLNINSLCTSLYKYILLIRILKTYVLFKKRLTSDAANVSSLLLFLGVLGCKTKSSKMHINLIGISSLFLAIKAQIRIEVSKIPIVFSIIWVNKQSLIIVNSLNKRSDSKKSGNILIIILLKMT